MRRASAAVALLSVSIVLVALPAKATYHLMVIEQVFLGLTEAPHAQYVLLRTQAPLQTAVYGQPFSVSNAAGNSVGTFGTFCTTPRQSCVLPAVSPACRGGGCPQPFDSNGRAILAATPWAQDLFCVVADLVATGVLPYPDGRVCFGDCAVQPGLCPSGPVDCVAYGAFTGNNAPFGTPAVAPLPGQALVADPARQNQFLAPGGTLLDNSIGFSAGTPAPQNFHGDSGAVDGSAGDPEGTGVFDENVLDAEVRVLFEADRRCALPAARRGADANLDTRVNAADLIATLLIVATGGGAT